MTYKDKLLAVYKHQNSGSIPWAAYGGFLLPCGENERYLRNAGCGWIHWTPVCSWLPPGMGHMNGWILESEVKNVDTSIRFVWRDGKRAIRRTYETPVGTIYEELEQEPGYHSNWVKKFMIEKHEHYEVVKYIVENTLFRECYGDFEEARDNLGTDGVELAVCDRSPFQKLLLEICGTEQLTFDLTDRPDIVEDLLSAMARKQDEAFSIIADSPAEVVWMVDNVTGDITTPGVFDKYCMPFYNRQCDLLHSRDKILAVHFDGRLKPLKTLIDSTNIDVIESFSFREMGGDMTIEEADAAWPDKSIVANIPSFLCNRGEREIRIYLEDLLTRVSPRKNFMLELSENFPPPELRRVLPILADVMSHQ